MALTLSLQELTFADTMSVKSSPLQFLGKHRKYKKEEVCWTFHFKTIKSYSHLTVDINVPELVSGKRQQRIWSAATVSKL